jgi:methylglutamate dehydrogenase subunit B
MRIPCPFCGERDLSEFVTRGEAAPPRPATQIDAPPETAQAMHDYVYLRDNPAGPAREYWYHAYGCRRWLLVERDTRTHVIASARLAREAGQ